MELDFENPNGALRMDLDFGNPDLNLKVGFKLRKNQILRFRINLKTLILN